jgi:hypothetical protein
VLVVPINVSQKHQGKVMGKKQLDMQSIVADSCDDCQSFALHWRQSKQAADEPVHEHK